MYAAINRQRKWFTGARHTKTGYLKTEYLKTEYLKTEYLKTGQIKTGKIKTGHIETGHMNAGTPGMKRICMLSGSEYDLRGKDYE